MRKIILLIWAVGAIIMPFSVASQRLTILSSTSSSSRPSGLRLFGRVVDAVTQIGPDGAKLMMYDGNGNITDSVTTRKMGPQGAASYVMFVDRDRDTTLIFDVVAPGYKTQTITFPVENIGRREGFREMPTFYLERAPRQLDEVTVTATKLKFYNRGDTLVYNADAFQLAEGSMLDALISQLPGAKIDSNGRITVNDEFVESLLLNGKNFFKGNNRIMLDNIGAYTVKNVEIYQGHTDMEKLMGATAPPSHLTMNIKLKKEYSVGLLFNAQAGAGTDDRYLGRLFASWFSPTTTISLVANSNNLNDNRKPGMDDSWTPEQMPSGIRREHTVGLDVNYQDVNNKNSYNANTVLTHTSHLSDRTTDRTNFFPSGLNTYEYAFSRGKDSNLKFTTFHWYSHRAKHGSASVQARADYEKRINRQSGVSAAFDDEQTGITAGILEAIYSDGSPDRLDAVINRSLTRSRTDGNRWYMSVNPMIIYNIPHTPDMLVWSNAFSYEDDRAGAWNDYSINYGADPTPAVATRKYIRSAPNSTLKNSSTLTYRLSLDNLRVNFGYEYLFEKRRRNQSTFALDRLADMGIFGELPEGYASAFDPDNSFTSSQYRNRHSILPEIIWSHKFGKVGMSAHLNARLSIDHGRLDYFEAGKSYPVSHTWRPTPLGEYKLGIELTSGGMSRAANSPSPIYHNMLSYDYSLIPQIPDLLHMVDVVNDNDPLNIALGNPNLKAARTQDHRLKWEFNPPGKPVRNALSLSARFTNDALTPGYTYDSSTGVRRTRTYNVDGNRSFGASDNLSWQFGSIKQFTLAVGGSAQFMRLADMVGYDVEVPEKSIVNTRLLSGDLGLTWQLGRQSLQFKGSYTGRVTSSTRDGFRDIDATHLNYGVIGNFVLPAGFGISTDFTCYTRRGYGSSQLDTTDPVWNARITYSPTKRWVIMFDSFDILHRLSNVNYAMTASGRTITVINTLPRYMLLSVQYRFSIQPKKR